MIKKREKSNISSNTKRYVIIAIVAAIAIAYIFSPYLINHIISQQLSNLGFSSSIQSTRPNFHSITFKSLAFSASKPALTIDASLQDVSVSYDLYDLLFSQNIDSIKVTALNVNLKPSGKVLTQTKETNDLQLFTPNELFDLVPVNNAYIENVTVNYPADDSHLLQIQERLSYSNQKFTTTLNYYENKQTKAELSLAINNDNSFSVNSQLHSDDKPLASSQSFTKNRLQQQIKGHITKVDNLLTLHAQQSIDIDKPSITSYWLEHSNNKHISAYLQQLSSTTGQISLNYKIAFNPLFTAKSLDIAASFNSHLKMLNSGPLLKAIGESEFNADIKVLNLTTNGDINWKNQLLTLSLAPTSHIDLTGFHDKNITSDALNLSLSSPLKLTLNHATKHLSTQAFSVKLAQTTLHTPYGSVQHTPLNFDIDQYDSSSHILSANFNVENSTFIAPPKISDTNIPASKVMASIKGTAKLTSDKVAVSINDLSIDARDFNNAAITTKKLTIALEEQPINLLFSLVDNTFAIADFSLALGEGQWQIPQGLITHAPITLAFSNIDTIKQQVSINSNVISAMIKGDQLPFEAMKINSSVQANYTDKQLTISIAEDTQATVQKVDSALKTDNITLDLNSPIQTRITLADNDIPKSLATIELSPFSLTVSGSTLVFPADNNQAEKAINYQNLILSVNSLSLFPLTLKANSKLQNVSFVDFPILSKFNIYADHQLNDKDYQGYAKVINTTLPISLSFDLNSYNYFKTSYAKWLLEPIDLAKHQDQIKQSIRSMLKTDTARDVLINKGEFTLNGKLTAQKNNIEATAQYQLNNLTGSLAQQPFADINYIGALQFKNNKLQAQASLSAKSIGKAIEVTNIAAQLDVTDILANSAELSINKLSAKVLEADVSIDALSTPLYQPKGQATLYVKGLPLNNVLALEQQPTLTGSGILNGQLPFSFDKKQLWVNHGQIHASQNGHIRYQANDSVKAFAQTNTGLKIALDVLEDFHYNKLDIIIDYSPDGSLVLKNNLAGQNPQWQEGQPIDFSINIEENLLQLLKTLNFTDSLNTKLEQKLNTQ